MSNTINGFSVPTPPSPLIARPNDFQSVSTGEQSSFQRLLFDSLNQVDSMQQSAQTAVERGLASNDLTQVEVLTSMKQADLVLRLMLQIRNKLVDAYDEIKQLRM